MNQAETNSICQLQNFCRQSDTLHVSVIQCIYLDFLTVSEQSFFRFRPNRICVIVFYCPKFHLCPECIDADDKINLWILWLLDCSLT